LQSEKIIGKFARGYAMNKEIKNVEISVKAKLLNLSKERSVDFNSILLRYFQERFLYRLTVSKYKNNFILKGGLLLIVVKVPMSRPSIDMDFLALKTKNDTDLIEKIFCEICLIESNDGVIFDNRNIKIERIIEEADYEGIRIKLPAMLGKIKNQVQVDLGFGDEIFGPPPKQ
jgi:hypothetical protein